MILEFTRFTRDLSRLELFIAISLIAILMGIGIRQMLILAAYAERQFLEATITNINTALHYQAGIYRLKGEYAKLAKMDKMNPLFLAMSEDKLKINNELDKFLAVQARPTISSFTGNYLGEISGIVDDGLEPGSWYFDTSSNVLIYTISNSEFFDTELGGLPRVRFRVDINIIDNNNNGIYDPIIDTYKDIELKKLEDYQWRM